MTLPPTAPSSGPFSRLARRISILFTLSFIALIVFIVLIFAPGPLQEQATVIVNHGESRASIATQLAEAHAVYASPLFRIAARFTGNGALKAGEYAIPPKASPAEIASMMHDGRSVVRLFTVAEGLTSAEIVDDLNREQPLTGPASIPAEGTLLPETYRYNYGDTRASLIARMQKAMQEKTAEIWAARDPAVNLHSPQEMVTLASIVEKETGKPEERPRIAAVFYNRLHFNMRLQSDPTVIYALTHGRGDLNRPLTHEDLSFASPINTYASDGLPPQPICNPGIAALQAVTHPEHNDFLYFVADGTGGHAFAANLAAHNANINRWHDALEKAAPHK